ncbi:hypothetical protein F5884DRAFT_733691 [Xylogone sp. PMI_703]|nr:hypothetical protein F5884DRAFT_733691 [Xylogone sp. PMI_703]
MKFLHFLLVLLTVSLTATVQTLTTMPRNPKDFKWLERHGLVAVPTRGDGNCLFNALSDQTVGNQENHKEIRAQVIEYMRANSDYYKSFIVVEPGGGVRRNPKRKNVAVPKTPIAQEPPSAAQIDEAFENHLARMAQGGTYGDNMEIVAFSQLYRTDVKVYQWTGHAYYISAPDDGTVKPVVHIAHHEYEHFSSVRNINGPFTGLPDVHDNEPSSQDSERRDSVATPTLAPWMIKTVESSLPYYIDPDIIRNTLIACQCDVDETVSRIIELNRSSPTSLGSGSRSGSSSVERELDSQDEDQIYGPNKRQNRKESLARKALRKQKQVNEQATPATQSVAASEPRPRTKIILRTKNHSLRSVSHVSDSASEAASTATAHPPPATPSTPIDASKTGSTSKTTQKQEGPQKKKKHTSAAAKKDLKKKAQKQARKEAKKPKAQSSKTPTTPETQQSPKKATRKSKRISPPMDQRIKVLHI